MKMKKKNIIDLVYCGVFIALGILLPFITFQNQKLGQILCLMHIPVLLCGFICGPYYGLAAGFITPLLRSVILGMPPMFPVALAMAFELAGYGLLSGLLYRLLPKKVHFAYISLILAMLGGRLIYGLAAWLLYSAAGNTYSLQIFLSSAFLTPWPGILLQLVVVVPLMLAVKAAGRKTHEAG